MKILRVLLIAWCCCLPFQGCSLLMPSKQKVSIDCSEKDATIFVNGATYRPPAKLKVKRNAVMLIQAQKPGFEPYSRAIDFHLSATGIVDTIGAILIFVPAVGLIAPGAWSLDETDINIHMIPVQHASAASQK